MPIELLCSECGTKLRVEDKYAEKLAQCPKCNFVNSVPSKSVEIADAVLVAPPSLSPDSANPFQAPTLDASPDFHPGFHVVTTSPMAITGFVLGVLGFPFAFCCILMVPVNIGAMVCGFVGLQQVNTGRYTGKGLAIAGIVLGAMGLLLFGVLMLVGLRNGAG